MMIRVVLGRGGGGGGDRGGNNDSDEEEELLRHQDYSSNESEEEDDEEVEDNTQMQTKGHEYDISLPAQHLYLGEMNEEGVASVQEEETTPILPLFHIPKHVLFPGETLPMHIYNPHAISMLRSAFTAHKPIAVCTDLRESAILDIPRRPKQEDLSQVGTTADIIACREDEEGSWFHGPRFIVKFLGRQRFKLLEVYKKVNGMMDVRVEILSDVNLLPYPPLLLSRPPSLVSGCEGSLHVARLPEATLHSHQQATRCRALLELPSLCQSSCPIPGWVLQKYNYDYLREQVLKAHQLNTLNNDGSDNLPTDVTELSYWLSRRLPVNDITKLELLSISCPTRRLMQGLKMLKELTELYCSECNTLITQKQYIFSMSVDGPLAAYVNPGGFVHDTLTVTESFNLKRSGRASTEHSWFPGYQWTIMNCKQCRDHKGWCFEAVKKNLSPTKFYGLRRPGLVLSVKKSDEQIS